MNSPIFISPRVIDTINSLPVDDRIAVASALAGELLLGGKVESGLTPIQSLAFSIIRSYVQSDTRRYAAC